MFLATTSLKEYWDMSDDQIFLGEWCLTAESSSDYPRSGDRVMPYLWRDLQSRKAAYEYCCDFFDQALPQVVDFMNRVHGTNKSIRYWQIIVGPWLLFYIHAMYDRYRCVLSAFEENSELKTAGVSSAFFWTPYDWHHYVTGINSDYYNLQLYSQIFLALGISYETRDDDSWLEALLGSIDSSYYLEATRKKNTGYKKILHDVVSRFFSRDKNRIVVSGLFNRNINHYILAIASGLKVDLLPRLSRDIDVIQEFNKPSLSMRASLSSILVDSSDMEFSKVFAQTIARNFPCCYIEDYARRQSEVSDNYSEIEVIASAHGWISDENYKFIAAEAVEKGACLIGSQHGGNNGIEKDILYERHITSVVDKYYTYGKWSTNTSVFSNAITGSALEFNPHYTNKYNGDEAYQQLLFVGTATPRYLTQFRSGACYSQFREYQQWQVRFIDNLPCEIFENSLFRLLDTAWGSKQILQSTFSGLRLDDFTASFFQRVRKSRIVVIDNLYTTFVQTLLMNKPVVLFFDANSTDFYSHATPVLKALENAGILHMTPENAARHVSRVWSCPEDWWLSDVVQNARQKYIEMFALNNDSWLGQWKKLLLKANSNEYE